MAECYAEPNEIEALIKAYKIDSTSLFTKSTEKEIQGMHKKKVFEPVQKSDAECSEYLGLDL